ncbi:MAG: 50S ribosomal protein L29 [bacterium]
MEWKELEKMSANELKRLLKEERAQLHEMCLKLSVNQIKDVRGIRKSRRQVAQILTRLRQLEQTAQK